MINIGKLLFKSRKTGHSTTNWIVRLYVLRKFNFRCQGCNRTYNPKKAEKYSFLYFGDLQIDHIIPFARGGTNDISNYQPMCSRCNKQKGTKINE
jgi:5-methylcytosine-specific restriction protein A